MSAHDGGVNHHVLIVVIAGQKPENPLENAALGPSVEALIDDLPVAKALGQIAPGDAGAKSEQNGFNEQPIVRRRAANMALAPRQNILDRIPLILRGPYCYFRPRTATVYLASSGPAEKL